MEFRRITNLPPYVFTIINGLKIEARRAGADVIDLGLRQPRHPVARRSPSRSWPRRRATAQPPLLAVAGPPQAARGGRRATTSATWGVELDPELEITNTIGSKEGFSHLMWVLLDRGDAAIVPSPSYPIHIYGPLFAGADLRQVPMRGARRPASAATTSPSDFFDSLDDRLRHRLAQAARARDLVPAQPDRGRASTSPSCSASSTSAASAT